jgi:hypothetical protein
MNGTGEDVKVLLFELTTSDVLTRAVAAAKPEQLTALAGILSEGHAAVLARLRLPAQRVWLTRRKHRTRRA